MILLLFMVFHVKVMIESITPTGLSVRQLPLSIGLIGTLASLDIIFIDFPQVAHAKALAV
jgi:hypothetical protein